jgi:hypothetical protein
MGLFEKRRAKKFFEFLQNWKDEDPATHQGKDLFFLLRSFMEHPSLGINLDRDSMKTVYEKFGLEPGTQDFIGHAMALYLDDEYVRYSITSKNSLSFSKPPPLVTSPNPHGQHMTASSSTHLPWLGTANPHTSTPSTVSANYHNPSLVSVPFTGALIC